MQIIISEKRIWYFAFFLLIVKCVFYLFYKWFELDTLFGGGNDADYYHNYAIGYYRVSVNYWADILRFLNDNELYDRDNITLILFVTSNTLIPYLYYKMIKVQADEITLVKAASIFLVIFYPTLFTLTLDVYRDVLMFTALSLAFLMYKKILETNWLIGNVYFIAFMSLAYFLYLMRDYLGFALALTPFVYLIFTKTSKYIKTWIIIYLGVLVLVKITGALDEILLYRERFLLGGSTLGITLYDKNPIMFLFYYFFSTLGQLLGLFLVSINSIILFILETVPFCLAFRYLLRNTKFMNKFVVFLLTFFVIYTTIWLLGNDNLGTAARLRIPSYLVVFASMFIVYQTKIVAGYEMIKENKKKI